MEPCDTEGSMGESPVCRQFALFGKCSFKNCYFVNVTGSHAAGVEFVSLTSSPVSGWPAPDLGNTAIAI